MVNSTVLIIEYLLLVIPKYIFREFQDDFLKLLKRQFGMWWTLTNFFYRFSVLFTS